MRTADVSDGASLSVGIPDLELKSLNRDSALHCAALRCASLRFAALRCAALRCAALRCAALCFAALYQVWEDGGSSQHHRDF